MSFFGQFGMRGSELHMERPVPFLHARKLLRRSTQSHTSTRTIDCVTKELPEVLPRIDELLRRLEHQLQQLCHVRDAVAVGATLGEQQHACLLRVAVLSQTSIGIPTCVQNRGTRTHSFSQQQVLTRMTATVFHFHNTNFDLLGTRCRGICKVSTETYAFDISTQASHS